MVQSLPFGVAVDVNDLLDPIPANDPYTQLTNAVIQKVAKSANRMPREAANSTTINTYGQQSLTLDIGLRGRLQWVFVQADVNSSITGADFLTHFGLAVDVKHCKLVDTTTTLFVVDIAASEPSVSIQLTVQRSPFADPLKDYLSLNKTSPIPHGQQILTNAASNSAVGAVLLQQVNDQLQPSAFVSQKLKPAQTRYSTFSREILTIYLVIRHFRRLLEGRDFSIHTDHKHLTYALRAKPDRYTDKEVHIRYVGGSDHAVADALSCPDINTLTPDFDLAKLTDLQSGDKSIDDLHSTIDLQLRDAPLPASPDVPSKLKLLRTNLGELGRRYFDALTLQKAIDLHTAFSKLESAWGGKDNVFLSRYRFCQMRQESNQCVSDFITNLTLAIQDCGYKEIKADNFEHAMLVQQLIVGLRDEKARENLLSEKKDLSWEKACDIASHRERVRQNLQQLNRSNDGVIASLESEMAVSLVNTAVSSPKQRPSAPSKQLPSCYRCGYSADAADTAAAENASMENRWCQLRDTVQSTALAVLGRAPRQHQDWFDDNDAAIERLPQVETNVDIDLPPSLQETIRAVQQLSSGKAPGSDAIPAEVYKHGGPQMMDHLTTLFQEMWHQGEVPQDFKDATIVHLYKRKGNRQVCDNHSGISLLNIAGTIFARILLNRLNNHLEQGLLPESQCGFRRHRGTTDMIFAARQLQEKCQEMRTHLYFTFVDLTKAFDTVNPEGLWKIMQKFGCPERFTQMVRQLHDGMMARVTDS
nr:unnamed protein product [Spirometra erinaceieuropaei]